MGMLSSLGGKRNSSSSKPKKVSRKPKKRKSVEVVYVTSKPSSKKSSSKKSSHKSLFDGRGNLGLSTRKAANKFIKKTGKKTAKYVKKKGIKGARFIKEKAKEKAPIIKSKIVSGAAYLKGRLTRRKDENNSAIQSKSDREILEKKHIGKQVDMRGNNEDVISVQKETKHDEKEHMPVSEAPINKKDFRM